MSNFNVQKSKGKSLTMKIVLCLIIIVVFMFIFMVVRRMNVNARYSKAVKEYLAKAYPDETFHVTEQWHDLRDSGPIPHFDFPDLCYYYVIPDSEPDYGFRVYISKAKYSYRIEKIEDTYYWRILRRQIQNFVIEHLYDELGEMKVDLRESGLLFGFEGFTSDSTLQDYLERGKHFAPLISVYLPKSIDETDEEEITELLKELVLELTEGTDVFLGVSTIGVLCLESPADFDLLETEKDIDPLYDNRRIIEAPEGRFYWQRRFKSLRAAGLRFENAQ